MKQNNLFKELSVFFLGVSVGCLCAGLALRPGTSGVGDVLLICALFAAILSCGMLVIHRARAINRRKLDELEALLHHSDEKNTDDVTELAETLKRLSAGDRSVRVGKVDGQLCTLAEQINALAETLEAAEREQNTFVSTVAHDLRSPMSSIIGFVDAMLDGTIPKESHERYLALVSTECKRLATLVFDLLDVSRLRSGKSVISAEPCDICEISRTVLISLAENIEEKSLDVSFNSQRHNMTVLADKQALHRVMLNLLDNAVKYSRDNARLEIRIAESDENVKVEVFNEGQGVRDDELDRILEPFYRTDDGRAQFKGGSGLGIYICSMILKSHGIPLHLESLYGEWFRASFTLSRPQA